MKKFLSILLALIMLVSTCMLTSCGGEEDNGTDNSGSNVGEENNGGSNGGSNNNGGSNGGSDNNGGSNGGSNNGGSADNSQKIDMSKLTDITPFTEGYAFAELNRDLSKAYCIDKSGNLKFTLDIKVGLQISGFYNGITTFGGSEKSVYICDKNGNITTPADLGGDKILVDMTFPDRAPVPLFQDGYFFVKKTTTTFTSSKNEAALYNYKLEKVHDFSEELYRLYEDFYGAQCYNGYLYEYNGYDTPRVFDPATGKVVTDLEAFVANLELDHPSDLWVRRDLVYYNMLDSKKKVDLSEYEQTFYYAGDFEDGLSYVCFESANVYFFTILKEDGSFAFEPVQLKGYTPTVFYSNGRFIVKTSKGLDIFLETFDSTGKIAEHTIDTEGTMLYIDFSDDVLTLNFPIQNKVQLFKYDLTPLF